MIGTPTDSSIRGVEAITLGADDAPAMVEVDRTHEAGPFTRRTHELGRSLEFGSMDSLLRWWASG